MNGRTGTGWTRILRWMLGLALVWAALPKLANLTEFYDNLVAYRLPLSEPFLRLVAISLPWLELLCGLMLAVNRWTRAGLAWAMLLFAAFALATGQAWGRGLDVSCGCFKLSLFGLNGDTTGAFERAFESAGFAFFRALFLGGTAFYLLRRQSKGLYSSL